MSGTGNALTAVDVVYYAVIKAVFLSNHSLMPNTLLINSVNFLLLLDLKKSLKFPYLVQTC